MGCSGEVRLACRGAWVAALGEAARRCGVLAIARP